jgi:hypothetical protein
VSIQRRWLLPVVLPARAIAVIPMIIYEINSAPLIVSVRINLDIDRDITRLHIYRFSLKARDTSHECR